MYKYFKELEKPNDYTLQLLDTYELNKDSISLSFLPLGFYEKYKSLFEIINDLKFLLKNCSINDLVKKVIVERKYLYYQLNMFLKNDKDSLLYDDENIIVTSNNIAYKLRKYKEFTRLLYQIDYFDKKETWEKVICLFDEALNDIQEHNVSLNVNNNNQKKIKVTLPNAWYLTHYGDLYNTGCSYTKTNLSYEIDKIKTLDLRHTKILTDEKEKYLNLKKEIIERGYVTPLEYEKYLNSAYGFASFDDGYLKNCYDPKVVKIICGVVSAHASLYNFLELLSKYTKNPNLEWKRLIRFTNGEVDEMLVRAMGFSKMDFEKEKIIVTSNIKFTDKFSEYLKRGYDIDYHNPIAISKKNGILKQIDSATVKKQINKHEKVKKYNKSKIF